MVMFFGFGLLILQLIGHSPGKIPHLSHYKWTNPTYKWGALVNLTEPCGTARRARFAAAAVASPSHTNLVGGLNRQPNLKNDGVKVNWEDET